MSVTVLAEARGRLGDCAVCCCCLGVELVDRCINDHVRKITAVGIFDYFHSLNRKLLCSLINYFIGAVDLYYTFENIFLRRNI